MRNLSATNDPFPSQPHKNERYLKQLVKFQNQIRPTMARKAATWSNQTNQYLSSPTSGNIKTLADFLAQAGDNGTQTWLQSNPNPPLLAVGIAHAIKQIQRYIPRDKTSAVSTLVQLIRRAASSPTLLQDDEFNGTVLDDIDSKLQQLAPIIMAAIEQFVAKEHPMTTKMSFLQNVRAAARRFLAADPEEYTTLLKNTFSGEDAIAPTTVVKLSRFLSAAAQCVYKTHDMVIDGKSPDAITIKFTPVNPDGDKDFDDRSFELQISKVAEGTYVIESLNSDTENLIRENAPALDNLINQVNEELNTPKTKLSHLAKLRQAANAPARVNPNSNIEKNRKAVELWIKHARDKGKIPPFVETKAIHVEENSASIDFMITMAGIDCIIGNLEFKHDADSRVWRISKWSGVFKSTLWQAFASEVFVIKTPIDNRKEQKKQEPTDSDEQTEVEPQDTLKSTSNAILARARQHTAKAKKAFLFANQKWQREAAKTFENMGMLSHLDYFIGNQKDPDGMGYSFYIGFANDDLYERAKNAFDKKYRRIINNPAARDPYKIVSQDKLMPPQPRKPARPEGELHLSPE